MNDTANGAPPSGKAAVASLITLFVGAFLTITTETLPMGLLPQMSESIGVSQSMIGQLVSFYALVTLFVTLPLTAWTSHWPRRRLFVTIMVVFAVSNLLLAASPNYAVAVVARLIAAAVHGVLWSMMATYATRLVPPKKAGRAVATVFAGNSAALTLGVPLGTAVGTALGWRTSFVAMGVIAVLVVLAGSVLLPQVEGAKSGKVGIGQAFRTPGIKAIVLATTLIMLAHFTFYTYIAPYLEDRGITEGGVSGALFAFGVAGIVGVWAAGVLVDKRPRGALLWAVGLVTLSLVGLGVINGAPAVTVGLTIILGLAYAALPTLLQSAALKAAPAAQTAASALFILAFNLGIFAGSGAGGQFLARLGVGSLPAIAAVLAAAATLVVVMARAYGFPTARPDVPQASVEETKPEPIAV
ncbi:MFS transporter [Streptomyces sp. A1-5]|uniref:MFS transporter n=1 Tax=Streptomyces sp. A1-5 TaxID=2738410 RepID=UPI001F2DF3A0|nr:MFS transporter [Streptomyces sp. A1-5]UJB42752.1 MFS transporter [Streptomyces sp. A1-5]